MKKGIFILIFLLLLIFWFGESRTFYCTGGKCLTVWKTFNNKCFIIPGKYYGVFPPETEFIRTANNSYVTIYFSEEIGDAIIVRGREGIVIKDDNKGLSILDYNKNPLKYREVLYKPGKKKFNDVKDNANYIDINVPENYAVSKDGKKL